ncbi:MAG: hypothetical protein K8T10_04460 [Candidatus Eremiobacteraeota bacterium]|nr:hypothetical protein [Candidatus Eremiobacteraeota bacterium]
MEKLIIPLKELEYKDLPMVGGKAAVIRILTMQGILVPDALIITGELYKKIVSENPEFKELLSKIKSVNPAESRKYLVKIIDFFKRLEFPEDFKNLLLNRLPLLHFPLFNTLAVRPSPIFSESPTEIISGIHYSIMNVEKFPNLLEAIKIVWASMWSLKAFNFRQKNFIPHEMMTMAIIVQIMLRTEYSGNAYSNDPDNPEHIKINAGWGIPDGIIDGSVPYDTVILKVEKLDEDNYSFPVREEQIAIKDKMQVYQGEKKIITDTPPERVEMPILLSYEQSEIANYARKIESAFGKPQVITWGRERKVHILDANPTEKAKEVSKHRLIYPNIELMDSPPSYLTLTALRDIEGVLLQKMAEKCGEKNANLPAPLVTFMGRPYLNLELLLYLFNKIKVPQAYTLNALQGLDVSSGISPENEEDILQINMLDSIWIINWIDSIKEEMESEIKSLGKRVEQISQIRISGVAKSDLCKILTDIMNEFTNLQDRTLIQGAIILCIVLLKKKKSDSKDEKEHEIPTVPEIIDYRFMRDIILLTKEAIENQEVLDLFRKSNGKSQVSLDELRETNFYNSLISFINKYSYMSLCPLDASSPRIYEKPMLIPEIIGFLINHPASASSMDRLMKNIRKQGKSVFSKQKSGFLGNILSMGKTKPDEITSKLTHLILLAGKSLELNIILTDILRKVLLEIGSHFKKADMIEKPEDIFSLEIEEILKGAALKYTDYKPVVSSRNENSNTWKGYSAPTIVSGSRLNISSLSRKITQEEKSFRCIPLNRGKIRGPIKIIKSFQDLFSIEAGEVIIVERMNFVYSPFLSVAGGVIIERVNPLLPDYTQCRLAGIPAVGGIPGITEFAQNGEIVEIDGDRLNFFQ